ncbi:MAG: hypothetical protein JW751_17485 [Polyangiaceae bacterium]|nr:hypothetical protein [Polyangiaceae bacterium]
MSLSSNASAPAADTWSAGEDVGLSDVPESLLQDKEGSDGGPHWVEVQLADAEGTRRWVHCQAECHPAGFDVRAAGPEPGQRSSLRLVRTGSVLGRAGLVSTSSLVASAAPGELAPPEASSSASARRMRGKARPERSPDPLLPESLVNQRMPVVDERIFMAMVHSGELVAERLGQLHYTRWADYQAAFDRRLKAQEPKLKPSDDLNDIRVQLGYLPKKGHR